MVSAGCDLGRWFLLQRKYSSFISNLYVSIHAQWTIKHSHTHYSQNGQGPADVERVVLEEFGRCMSQIITSAQTGKCVGKNANFYC